MTLCDFVNKYINKKVDFDGAFGAQCVDLFRQYCKDVLEIHEHTGAVEGAKDLFYNHNKMIQKKYFVRISNKNVKYGDVVIYDSTKTNKYGHVAIILGIVDNSSILVFEQNGFTQDGAKITLRTFNNYLGVLRKL